MNHVLMKTLLLRSSFLGLPSETSEVHDTGVQGPECYDGGWAVTLSTFPLGKVHQGKLCSLCILIYIFPSQSK